MSSNRAVLRQIAWHLLDTAPDGLPRSWFAPEAQTALTPVPRRAVSPTPVLPVAPAQGHRDSSVANAEPGDLLQLQQTAQQCRKCRLCETRNKVVFGSGKTVQPVIAFVGEGPGADEDLAGEPFVGRAGELLTAAITKGLKLRREDVYICNVVKCRPPQNRAPLPDEVSSCAPYLFRQLELIQPRVIVTLGSPAQQALTGITMGITKLRGRWLEWRGIKLMPTFHPAYILRNPAVKREFWEDLQLVIKELELS